MKTFLLFSTLLIAGSQLAEAQYGYGGYYGGRGRNIVPQAQTPVKEPEPKTAEELVEEEMPKIIEAVELNDFEAAVVSTILTKYVQQRIELQILKLSPEDTRAALEKIAVAQREEMEQSLPPEKYEAILELEQSGYKKLKKKKKKKTKT